MRKYQNGGSKPSGSSKPVKVIKRKPAEAKKPEAFEPVGPRQTIPYSGAGYSYKKGGRIKAQNGKQQYASVMKKPVVASAPKKAAPKKEKSWFEKAKGYFDRIVEANAIKNESTNRGFMEQFGTKEQQEWARKQSKPKQKTGGKTWDIDKSGKVTKKDILIARGVLPKTAKRGSALKKSQGGISMTRMANMKRGGKCKYGC